MIWKGDRRWPSVENVAYPGHDLHNYVQPQPRKLQRAFCRAYYVYYRLGIVDIDRVSRIGFPSLGPLEDSLRGDQ